MKFQFATETIDIESIIIDGVKCCCSVFVRMLPIIAVMSVLSKGMTKLAHLLHVSPIGKPVPSMSLHMATDPLSIIASMFFGVVSLLLGSVALLHLYRCVHEDDPSIAKTIERVLGNTLSLVMADFCYFGILVVGIVLLIIPGVYLGVMFLFFVPAILFEKRYFWSSMIQSWMLVKGSWWLVFTVMLMSIALYLVFMSMPSLLFGITSTLVLFLLRFGMNLFLMPLVLSIYLVLWNELNIRYRLKQQELADQS